MADPIMLTIFFIVFIALLLLGLQIGTVLLVTGILGIFLLGGIGPLTGILQTDPFARVASYALTTIPLFVLMSQFIMHSDIVKYLYHLVFKLSRGKPGILGVFTIILGGFLGAVSGSATAISATLGQISVPELKKHGYSEDLAGAIAASAGTLSTLIPPSIGLIIYGAITQTPVGSLFMAVIIPGILTVLVLVICTSIMYKLSTKEKVAVNEVAATTTVEDFPKSKYVISIVASVVIMGAIFGGIYAGVFTPTEAGGVGAFVSLVAALLLGKVNKSFIKNSFVSTVKITCMVLFIMIGAAVFARFVSLSMLPRKLMGLLEPLASTPILVIILLLVAYFFLFMFIEGAAVILMTVPITLPIAEMAGLGALEFGILISVVGAAGMLTPPVGLCVYAVSGVTKTPIEKLFRHTTVFAIAVTVVVVTIALIFPQIITWLPSTM
ncbi:Neu5Ac permease [Alkalihalophilus pseudofirmus]|uniref:TRAP transporter large permease n=1 Tax=Alkalihalobacterium alkalinitrilicum TaxID=427920 RepID=UPI00094DA755|nr:TRAP transporter large permease [Alkalihalobacterium alkalinitrilicum]OLO36371.1 Neu5Ac permease [Alkalihalophilus pseudofirmus]